MGSLSGEGLWEIKAFRSEGDRSVISPEDKTMKRVGSAEVWTAALNNFSIISYSLSSE
jgi:hypothetical protein